VGKKKRKGFHHSRDMKDEEVWGGHFSQKFTGGEKVKRDTTKRFVKRRGDYGYCDREKKGVTFRE